MHGRRKTAGRTQACALRRSFRRVMVVVSWSNRAAARTPAGESTGRNGPRERDQPVGGAYGVMVWAVPESLWPTPNASAHRSMRPTRRAAEARTRPEPFALGHRRTSDPHSLKHPRAALARRKTSASIEQLSIQNSSLKAAQRPTAPDAPSECNVSLIFEAPIRRAPSGSPRHSARATAIARRRD